MGGKPLIELSVIIPTLNEQVALEGLLSDLSAQEHIRLQIIVADGGSSDATQQIADAHASQWLPTLRGRAVQMNAGRQLARCRHLLFLHADSRLPDTALLARALKALTAEPDNCAGHFGLRFVDTAATSKAFYRHLAHKSRLNRPETIHGDQGLLLSARFFDELGGFSTQLPFLEDHVISQQIFERGQWLLLPGDLHTSARRFEQEGRAARYFLMMLMMCAHRAGLHRFFEQAPSLYPTQAETERLSVAPFLELLLQLAAERPDFWRIMAAYTLDNAWQVAFVMDEWLGASLMLPLHDRLSPFWPRAWLEPVLAPVLKQLFSGPVLSALKQREKS